MNAIGEFEKAVDEMAELIAQLPIDPQAKIMAERALEDCYEIVLAAMEQEDEEEQ